MIHELDTVVLTIDVMEHGLQIGDVGTVVLVIQNGHGYVVEFMTLNGDTVAVVPLEADKVRAVQDDEIAHVRRCTLVA
jgi:hypothetical protein